MFDALTLIGLWHSLPGYFELPSMREAVLLPALISFALWHVRRGESLPEFTGPLFLAGTALTLVFSVFRDTGVQQSIHALPAYTLLMVLMPQRFAPSWQQAFGLSFSSMLVADIWGAAAHCVAQEGQIPLTFYYGIGGAGFKDGLFICSWILPAVLFSMNAMRRKGIGDEKVSHLLAALFKRCFAPTSSRTP